MSERHRMLLSKLAAVRMRDADVTRLRRAYASHVEYTRRAYMDYCNGLPNAIYMCHHLHSCTPLFALHVQVVNNNNIQDNVYGAVIMAEPLRKFTRFIWWT